jgi:arylsulfatase A-like enzyme
MADIVIEELAAMPGGRPAFFYAHLLDAHTPYELSGKKDSPFEGYLAELGRVDTAVDQIWTAVRRLGLAPRTYFIISSDHGESFGERGKRFHAWGLKEDLIHVPLLVHGPGVGRGSDNALVSTNDIGPTVLDVFGVPTPAAFIGESLLPHALGHPRPLTRPVLAETRLKQAFLHPDGIKVIRDNRRGTVEVYDLRYDPGELRNRVGDMTPTMRLALLQLDQFFRVHTYGLGGYSPPYRP